MSKLLAVSFIYITRKSKENPLFFFLFSVWPACFLLMSGLLLGVLFVLAELDLGGALHSRHRAQLLLALSSTVIRTNFKMPYTP